MLATTGEENMRPSSENRFHSKRRSTKISFGCEMPSPSTVVKQIQLSQKILENPLRDITSLNNSNRNENRPLIPYDHFIYSTISRDEAENTKPRITSKDFSAQGSSHQTPFFTRSLAAAVQDNSNQAVPTYQPFTTLGNPPSTIHELENTNESEIQRSSIDSVLNKSMFLPRIRSLRQKRLSQTLGQNEGSQKEFSSSPRYETTNFRDELLAEKKSDAINILSELDINVNYSTGSRLINRVMRQANNNSNPALSLK